ncbi:MAG: hypothetical protein A3K19_29845 [Lentisphaerae bacterium RIFOXYB12_FULL_65_16]|nr:MAG: hypothetical protein A3K18_33455 [Lentisphaerae bacterium RIFOXYA12_64_32]OGV86532.1 MAG: hypothetical protein A3K19_29845 [Lentisphaerae bacterium RIFOXYB12_FULL_65_16]
MKNLSEKVLKQRADAHRRALSKGGISVSGSLVRILRKCGRENCRCAQDPDARHPSHVLTSKVKKKTKVVYVPVDMVEEVGNWVQDRRRIKRLLAEMDTLAEQLIRSHVRVSRAVGRNRARLAATRPT